MTKRLLSIFTVIFIVICMSSCTFNNSGSDNGSNNDVSQNNNSEITSNTPVRGGVLNLCMYEVDSLNPLITMNKNNTDVLNLVFDGLFTLASDFSVQNNLCESYVVSPDGLNYSFVIKSGVTFHDGTKLTAKDVDASFKLISEAQSPYLSRYDNVDATSADGMNWHVTLNAPIVNFPALLDFPVLPQKDAHMDTLISNISYIPNGTGIYKISDYKTTKELHLIINENHFSGKYPNITDIKIHLVSDKQTAISMFENLYVDVLPETVINLDEYTPKRHTTQTIIYPKNTLTFLGINNQKPILLTPLARLAVCYCVDKNTIVNNSRTNISFPANIPVNRYFAYYNSEIEPTVCDVQKATNLLTEDGFYDSDGDGILEKDIYGEKHIASLDILVNEDNQSRVKIAETIKNALIKAGIYSTVTAVDFQTYYDRIYAKDYDLFIGSTNISQNVDLSFLFQTDKNMFGFSSQRIDSCLSAMKADSNPENLSALFKDLCVYLYEEAPICPIYFDNAILICDKKIKGNIKPSQGNIFANIHEWYID